MGCNSPAGKVENAKEDIAEKEQELDKAKQAYQTELENFRKESTEKISENERIIADFRAKIAKEKKEVRVVYEKKIAELEVKNNQLKAKITDYKAETRENWDSFKTEFSHDMDELGNAFRDLTKDNVK